MVGKNLHGRAANNVDGKMSLRNPIFMPITFKTMLYAFGLFFILFSVFLIDSVKSNPWKGCDMIDSASCDDFSMAVIGDSISWGSGLNENEKYYSIIGEWIANALNRSVKKQILAHTGAIIDRRSDHTSKEQDFISENPSIFEQIDLIREPNKVDLVLVSGGINDIGVTNIINPLISADEIESKAMSINKSMTNMLIRLADKCNNAKIIVTGYYPIISKDSDLSELKLLCNVYSLMDNSIAKNRLIDNSNIFYNTSKMSLQKAVNNSNNYSLERFSESRIIFVDVSFPEEHCYGTKSSWLWKLVTKEKYFYNDTGINYETKYHLLNFVINDHKFIYRTTVLEPRLLSSVTCMYSTCPFSCPQILDVISAIGHPNTQGAKRYSDKIKFDISKNIWVYFVPRERGEKD